MLGPIWCRLPCLVGCASNRGRAGCCLYGLSAPTARLLSGTAGNRHDQRRPERRGRPSSQRPGKGVSGRCRLAGSRPSTRTVGEPGNHARSAAAWSVIKVVRIQQQGRARRGVVGPAPRPPGSSGGPLHTGLPSLGRQMLPGRSGDSHAVPTERSTAPFRTGARPAEPLAGRAQLHMLEPRILDPCCHPCALKSDQLDTAAHGQVHTLPILSRIGQPAQGRLVEQVTDRLHHTSTSRHCPPSGRPLAAGACSAGRPFRGRQP
jgi:hypothetical protein